MHQNMLCLDFIYKRYKGSKSFIGRLIKLFGGSNMKVVDIMKFHIYVLSNTYGVGFSTLYLSTLYAIELVVPPKLTSF